MALHVTIDRTKCMGSGNCGFWAPGAFDLDDEGLAYVVDPAGAPEPLVHKAAEGCPTQAIAVAADDSSS